jgi:hypothetical protein
VFEHAWVRFMAMGLLLSAWELGNLFAWLASRNSRTFAPPMPPTPRWEHFVRFAAITMVYVLLGREGGPMLGALANQIGLAVALLAVVIRIATRHGSTLLRYPQLAARLLFFAALPAALGAPHAWLVLTLPMAIVAVTAARRADAMLVASPDPAALTRLAIPYRFVPGVW